MYLYSYCHKSCVTPTFLLCGIIKVYSILFFASSTHFQQNIYSNIIRRLPSAYLWYPCVQGSVSLTSGTSSACQLSSLIQRFYFKALIKDKDVHWANSGKECSSCRMCARCIQLQTKCSTSNMFCSLAV